GRRRPGRARPSARSPAWVLTPVVEGTGGCRAPVGWSVGVGGRLDQLGEPVAGYPGGERLRPPPALLAGAVDALVVAGVAGVQLAEPVVLGAVSGACLHGRDLLSGSGRGTVVAGGGGAAGGGGRSRPGR